MLDPYWALRTGSVPLWMLFNMQPSLDRVRRYISETGGFDKILLMLFAHGIDSIGLPPIEAWRAVLAQARRHGAFLGVDESAYPAHFSTFARYDDGLRNLSPRYELPCPLPVERLRHELSAENDDPRIRLVDAD